MGISDFCKELTDCSAWNVAAVGANGLERIPRVVEGMLVLLSAMTPNGMKCPLLYRRLNTRHIALWCSRCRKLACPLLCLRDYCESLGGKRFDGTRLDQASDGCALAGSIGEGGGLVMEFFAVELTLGSLGSLKTGMGWIALWGAIGEPLFGLLALMTKECKETHCSPKEWSCLGAAKACETLYQAGQETPLISICSGGFSMYQAYREIEWDEPQ